MNYRRLGRTGLSVSEVGFGTIPILRGSVPVLPDYYNLSDEEALTVMEHAYRLGCNLYDTAIVPEYGDAEIKLGKFAARIGREKLLFPTRHVFLTETKYIWRARLPVKIWAPGRTCTLYTRWMPPMKRPSFKRAARWTPCQN